MSASFSKVVMLLSALVPVAISTERYCCKCTKPIDDRKDKGMHWFVTINWQSLEYDQEEVSKRAKGLFTNYANKTALLCEDCNRAARSSGLCIFNHLDCALDRTDRSDKHEIVPYGPYLLRSFFALKQHNWEAFESIWDKIVEIDLAKRHKDLLDTAKSTMSWAEIHEREAKIKSDFEKFKVESAKRNDEFDQMVKSEADKSKRYLERLAGSKTSLDQTMADHEAYLRESNRRSKASLAKFDAAFEKQKLKDAAFLAKLDATMEQSRQEEPIVADTTKAQSSETSQGVKRNWMAGVGVILLLVFAGVARLLAVRGSQSATWYSSF